MFYSDDLPNSITDGLLLASCLLVVAACGTPEREAADADLLAERDAYAALDSSHVVVIASSDEPGTRLLLLGRLLRSEDDEPVANHPVQLFHTDATGSYDESVPGDELTARLQGSVVTDGEGRFLVSTILPAGYDGGAGGHIHNLVKGAAPEFYNFNFGGSLGQRVMFWFERSDQHILLDSKQKADTVLAIAPLRVRGLMPPETP